MSASGRSETAGLSSTFVSSRPYSVIRTQVEMGANALFYYFYPRVYTKWAKCKRDLES